MTNDLPLKLSHNLRLHTYIQKITSPRGNHYKIRMKIQKKNYQIPSTSLAEFEFASRLHSELVSRPGDTDVPMQA